MLVTGNGTALTDTSSTSLKMESFNLTDSSPKATYTISDKGTTNSILTLGNSAGFTNAYSGVANDLLYLQDTNLTITGLVSGDGTLTLALASTGNFDVSTAASVLTISASITGTAGLAITGTGTTNLNANNTFNGAFAASGSSTVALGASGALGSVSAVNLSGSAVAFYSILSLTNVINPSATVSLSGTSALQTEGSAQTVASLTGTSGTAMYIGDYVSTASPPVTTAGSFTVGNSTSTTFAGTIIGTHASSSAPILTKVGTGTLTLTGTNTNFTGAIAVNGGTLAAAGSSGSALGGITSIAVNSTGTLLMGAANQLKTTAAVTLTGAAGTGNAATFGVGGFNQGSTTATGVGALTLTASSANNVIDFGSKSGVVSFASLTTNGALLTINNYLSNSGAAGGPDELIFNQDETANLANIAFTGYGVTTEQLVSGTAGSSNAFYEVFPLATAVPEPATLLGGVLLVGTASWNQRGRFRGLFAGKRSNVLV